MRLTIPLAHAEGAGTHCGKRCVCDKLVRKLHVGELGGQQQVLGRDRGAIIGRGAQQLLHSAALAIGIQTDPGLCDHLLFRIALERVCVEEAAAASDRTMEGSSGREGPGGH